MPTIRRRDDFTTAFKAIITKIERSSEVFKARQEGRVNCSSNNLEYFCASYLDGKINKPYAETHMYLFKELPSLINNPNPRPLAIAAPRGEGKSTIIGLAFILWNIVHNKSNCIVLIGANLSLAKETLRAIKYELTDNELIEQDYPNAFGEGSLWREEKIITKNDIAVVCVGTSGKIRGIKHKEHRPDCIIIDDCENEETVRSETSRANIDEWLNGAVMNLKDRRGKCVVVMIGTLLHEDSVLSRCMKNSKWKSHICRAIIEWPQRMDMWDVFSRTLINKGYDPAIEYYETNKDDMNKGAVQSWEGRSIVELMVDRAVNPISFNREMQQDPVSLSESIFGAGYKCYEELPQSSKLTYYASVDPSMGKEGKKRDPSAIIVGAVDEETRILYIVNAQIERTPPDKLIENIIATQELYQCSKWVIEDNNFQEFFKSEVIRRSLKFRNEVHAVGRTNLSDKKLRIERIQPAVMNGFIQFDPELDNVFVSQVKQYPNVEHDDGLDALEMLWKLTRQDMPSVRDYAAVRQVKHNPTYPTSGYPGKGKNNKYSGYHGR